jgi:predicted peptidase
MAQDTQPAKTSAADQDPSRVYEPREFVGSNGVPLKYRLIKPLNYQQGKKYPLILFLHGAGERGSDNSVTLKHAAKDFLDPERRAKFPAYVLIPQCPKDKKWSEVDWSKVTQRMDEHQPDWIRERFSSPKK